MRLPKKLLLLGSGELGKEFVIAAQRLGLEVVAVDRYADAPAHHVADAFAVIDMLDAKALERVVGEHRPDIIVPEIEAIRTEKLLEFESRGIQVTPSARAAHLTMNRDAIRDLAARKLKLKTARFSYAESREQLIAASQEVGYPNVVKPVMSSSGKGQTTVRHPSKSSTAWDYAVEGMRGDKVKVIVEQFIPFDLEITLLTVKQKSGPTRFVQPIGHRQERGDYQESWMPARIGKGQFLQAQKMAKKVTNALGGAGLFGVEFFISGTEVYFSELSPRPHDTGLVTLISQNLSEFELHLRAVLGLPIPEISYFGPSASAVILADAAIDAPTYLGVDQALKVKTAEVHLFGKPVARPFRRMGVAVARGKTTDEARRRARLAANRVKIRST